MEVNCIGQNNLATTFQGKNKKPKAATYPKIATGEQKPKALKSWGKGFLYGLLGGVPFVGSYLIGKKMIEQDNIQEALAQGKKNEKDDPGIFKSILRGVGTKLSMFIPFYGRYRVGKEILEQKNIQEALRTGDGKKAAEKPKFWKAWWTGVKMTLSQFVPFYGRYKIGKELETHNAINRVA